MINVYKERYHDVYNNVLVYRNLKERKKHLYSVKQNNKVILHGTNFYLVYCDFIVNENGRQNVIKNKRKYPHAFISGRLYVLMETDNNFENNENKITYNPYMNSSFMCKNEPIFESKIVFCGENGVFVVK